MFVVNRQGDREKVCFDKILVRIQRLAYGLHSLVDPSAIAKTVINGMFSGIKTSELDELAAQTCAYMAGTHPDFSKLAARIATSNLHKNTSEAFSVVADKLYHYHDAQGRSASLLAEDVYEFIKAHAQDLDAAIDYSRDFDYDYFAFKTLERSYLLRVNGAIVERPQHMLMRVSCGIHCGNLEKVLETYSLLSQKYFTHATPTLFNAGTQRPQMSSCFLLTMKDDSIDGIYETLKNCALISKTAGGIGVSVHTIRATDSYIRGTNGRSNGIVPMLRVFNATARYVDQGGGKRKGSFAVYLEPWHADILSFLDLKKNHGPEELRARDLFYALWIPDLFMQRVQENGNWTLFCPNECPGLADCWGAEFEKLYTCYESEKRGRSTVKARTIWFAILQSQIETGTPYMLYKDACNRKSNQKNLGTIRSSNLCTEIIEYTAPDEVAVCNLASLALPKFVDTETLTFNYERLRQVARVVTRNLNKIIDRNYYPLPEAEKSNKRHRPIGIGVQGLADALMLMKLPYESSEARKVNRTIFETIYYAAVECSVDLAREAGGPYESYVGSPISEGKFQFDLWNEERLERGLPLVELSGLWDWDRLREEVKIHGVRNSLLVAPMPTASTSQIMGNNESFEPYTANIYYRRVLSGEFFVVNPHLLRDLLERNLWSDSLKQQLIAANGSVQGISKIPSDLKALYKTVWEIRQKVILDMAADRAPFIDQSQSLNVHVTSPTYAKLSSMHFYGWKLGLKTGQYYLRTQAAADAIKFTVEHSLAKAAKGNAAVLGASAVASSNAEGGRGLLSKRFDALRGPAATLRLKGDEGHLSPDGSVLDDPLTPTSSSSLSEMDERLSAKGNWVSGRTAGGGETFSTAGTVSVGLEDGCTRKESIDTASSILPVFGSGRPFTPEFVSPVETPSSSGSSGNERETSASCRNTLLGRRAAGLDVSSESSQDVTVDGNVNAADISVNVTVKESGTSSSSENGVGTPFLFCPFRRAGMNDDEVCEACSG